MSKSIDSNHPQRQHLSFLDYLARVRNMSIRKFGDMDKSLNAIILQADKLRECTKLSELCNRALNELTLIVLL